MKSYLTGWYSWTSCLLKEHLFSTSCAKTHCSALRYSYPGKALMMFGSLTFASGSMLTLSIRRRSTLIADPSLTVTGGGISYSHQAFRRQDSGIEIHNAISVVHDMNNTAGPQGLVLTLLVFGVVPQMPLGFSDLPEQRERVKALHKARSEMAKAVAASRIRAATNRNVSSAVGNELRIGAKVLFYREKRKGWEGPYKVMAGNGPSYQSIDERSEIDSTFDRLIAGDVLLTQIQRRMSELRNSTE
eukprot:IDg6058t1